MRRMTLLWLALAAICGGVLFHMSQQVTDGRARLAVLDGDVRKESETIRVLEAEWSYLNQPERLEKLSKQYLDLAPLQGRQFARLADIPAQPEPAPAAETSPAETPAPETVAAAPEEKKAPVVPVVKTPAPSAKTVVKFRKPAPAPVPLKRAAPVTASGAGPGRSFGDVMKSLGVH